jgi:uncharacterized membrane protein YdjX (TVP38/TMEM64 family)
MSSEFLVHWFESFGRLNATSCAALTAIFIVSGFLPVPRTVLILGAGAAFGFRSLAIIVPSTTLGSILAFLLARGLLRNWVHLQTERRVKWKLVVQAVNDEGWLIVALMRFWGPVPNSAQNYLFGLTDIGLLPYSLITFVFSLPQIVLYTYLGASSRFTFLDDGTFFDLIWKGVTVITVLTIILLISRRMRKILLQLKAV